MSSSRDKGLNQVDSKYSNYFHISCAADVLLTLYIVLILIIIFVALKLQMWIYGINS